ncbi:lysine-specific demethylase JMJ29-like isoform X5 [Lycium barbarum]|uniref:lysine-specific demethylase JMJ29-like isoform X5 n=1 Tax=Lycium barbarum TaxID=112863 RepID=UPI00293F6B2F|nr:lysine-specific demethylase JMJ29-like isoform X5 [Lycium barbarum]
MQSKRKFVIMESSTSEEEDVVDSDEESCGNSKKRKKTGNQTRGGGGENSRRESKNCHQCQRNDKDKVVCCSKCKTKRYCLPCITRWYPGMPEEAILKACPVCRNLCNCTTCLRLDGLAKHLMFVEVKFSDEEKLEYSKHIVRALLPALEQFNTEQMIEKQIEYQSRALAVSEVNMRKAKYEKDERIYCNYCSAFIVDFHRSCSSCSFQLCLTCCTELRNGNLQADASEVRMQFIDNGPGYLHGKCCSITSTKNRTTEVKIRDRTKVAMASKWKPKENAVDTRRANFRHFRLHLCQGEPVVVTNVLDNALGLSWEPMVMWRIFRLITKAADVLNCLNWCKLEMNIHQFFKGYMEGRLDSYGWPQLLKLNHWPPSGLFDERLPRHGAEFFSCLPFMEYTHPQYGYLNLALRFPDNCSKPDLGPKAYIAYGFPKELGRGDSVTKLHYGVTDTANVLMHTQAVVPTIEQLSAIEKLKQIHKAQDQREFVAEASRMHESKAENKKYSQQSVKADCETNKEGEEYQDREDSISLFGQDSSEGFEEADGGALWDVFRRQDVPKLEEYLRKHFREFRHTYGSLLPQVVHPIHDQTFYLSTEHKRRLKKEYGIEPWTFVQKLGEAVFVPAGCPYQVRNLKSCINVAVDFVSPENVNECIRLTEEFRKLPRNHDARVDKLEVKKIIVHAMSQAVDQLEKTLFRNSEAGIATGLSSSSPISKSINAKPGPNMPKSSSSISEDLSSSKTAKREEYVAPSEDEKPATTEVNLHYPHPVLDVSSANKAMPGPDMPKSSSTLDDLSSSKTAKREEYVAPTENKKPRTAEVNLHSPLPVLSANKAQESTSIPSGKLKQSINKEDVESTFHTVKSFLKSIPEQCSSQQSGLQSNTASNQTLARVVFECSIRLSLEALAYDPMHEKEMYGAIAALNENPSSFFSDEQTKQLVKLKYEFPVMVKKWRDLARAESSYQEFLTSFEEDRKKLDDWIRSEARLKSEYVKKEEQARELEAALQTIKNQKKEIMDERQEASLAAQKIMLSAQEKAGKIESTKTELVTTKMRMDGLQKNWSNFQSKFP